jgi:hypothetical protein
MTSGHSDGFAPRVNSEEGHPRARVVDRLAPAFGRKSVTGSKLRSKTPMFSPLLTANLVTVTDFRMQFSGAMARAFLRSSGDLA